MFFTLLIFGFHLAAEAAQRALVTDNSACIDCASCLSDAVIVDGTTEIAGNAFRDCTSLTSVVIPESVTSIGNYAFYFTSYMKTEVVIPSNVTYLGFYAFQYSHLTSVVIPGTLKEIYQDTFNGCAFLENVTFGEGTETIWNGAFRSSGLKSVALPNSLIALKQDTFRQCASLTSVTFGTSIEDIGSSAFRSTALTSVVIPHGVYYIRSYAFAYTASLTSAILPNSLLQIETDAFRDTAIPDEPHPSLTISFTAGSEHAVYFGTSYGFGGSCSVPVQSIYTGNSGGIGKHISILCDGVPTVSPTLSPTMTPTVSFAPTFSPTVFPTMPPTANPSAHPTAMPTAVPTLSPTLMPTAFPTGVPTPTPTATPTVSPTYSFPPTLAPTASPSHTPSIAPTSTPTVHPTPRPSFSSFTTASMAGTIDVSGVLTLGYDELTAIEMALVAEVGRDCTALITAEDRRLSSIGDNSQLSLILNVNYVLTLILENNLDLTQSNFFSTLDSEIQTLVTSGDLTTAVNVALGSLLGGSFTPLTVEGTSADASSVVFDTVGDDDGNDDGATGNCPNKVVSKCLENMENNDGDWSYCDMCLCEQYGSYTGGDSCDGFDEELYACFLSSSGCKVQMRQSWIIGFTFIGVFSCVLICVGAYFMMRSRGTKVGTGTGVQ